MKTARTWLGVGLAIASVAGCAAPPRFEGDGQLTRMYERIVTGQGAADIGAVDCFLLQGRAAFAEHPDWGKEFLLRNSDDRRVGVAMGHWPFDRVAARELLILLCMKEFTDGGGDMEGMLVDGEVGDAETRILGEMVKWAGR